MSELPYKIGYGRPQVHSRFKKGQSGNPGGKRRPSDLLKENFDIALTVALNADENTLRKIKLGKTVQSLACNIVLHALDGRPSAQRLVLALLDREDGRGSAAPAQQTRPEPAAAFSGTEEGRELRSDGYDAFKTQFDKAVAAGSTEELLALVEEYEEAGEFPASGNS